MARAGRGAGGCFRPGWHAGSGALVRRRAQHACRLQSWEVGPLLSCASVKAGTPHPYMLTSTRPSINVLRQSPADVGVGHNAQLPLLLLQHLHQGCPGGGVGGPRRQRSVEQFGPNRGLGGGPALTARQPAWSLLHSAGRKENPGARLGTRCLAAIVWAGSGCALTAAAALHARRKVQRLPHSQLAVVRVQLQGSMRAQSAPGGHQTGGRGLNCAAANEAIQARSASPKGHSKNTNAHTTRTWEMYAAVRCGTIASRPCPL